MTSPFTAAALQFRIDMGDVSSNEARAFILLEEAAGRGASLCVLPEMWSTGFAYNHGLSSLARTTPGLLDRLRRFAAEKRVVIAGSLAEKAGAGVFNTMHVIDATGKVAGAYRKTHLFSPSGETDHFRRGAAASVIRASVGAIGPQICYDIRFPELSRKYFLEGATLLCISAQWPAVRRPHWDILNVARAIENQLFVVAANATGRSGDFQYDGGSAIISPTGEVLAAAGEDEGVTLAAIDPAKVEEFRRRIPCAQDRNERAYRKTRPAR
jgi:omega-amidase